MGLDMYLDRVNKKLHQEDINNYNIYLQKKDDLDFSEEFIKNYESHVSAKDFALDRQKDKLDEYEKWNKDGRNNNCFSFISHFVTSETPKFGDFETKEDLLNYFTAEAENIYNEVTENMDYFNSEEWNNLKDQFDGIEESEEAYWRKHSDLNGYFSDMAYERGISDNLNGESVILEKKDVKNLVKLVNKHLKKKSVFKVSGGCFWGNSDNSKWENTREVFTKLLHEFDFKNSTLIYRCSW